MLLTSMSKFKTTVWTLTAAVDQENGAGWPNVEVGRHVWGKPQGDEKTSISRAGRRLFTIADSSISGLVCESNIT